MASYTDCADIILYFPYHHSYLVQYSQQSTTSVQGAKNKINVTLVLLVVVVRTCCTTV